MLINVLVVVGIRSWQRQTGQVMKWWSSFVQFCKLQGISQLVLLLWRYKKQFGITWYVRKQIFEPQSISLRFSLIEREVDDFELRELFRAGFSDKWDNGVGIADIFSSEVPVETTFAFELETFKDNVGAWKYKIYFLRDCI